MDKVLVLLLSGACAIGVVDGVLEPGGQYVRLWDVIAGIMVLVGTVCWYHLDTNARGYRRTIWMNHAVVGLAMVGVPLYLYRSRPKGTRRVALYKLLGFYVLYCVTRGIGMFVGSLFAPG